MNKMSFIDFAWPENPEQYHVTCYREPVYTTTDSGETVFSGMGPVKRTITGSGAFFGTGAYNSFKALAALIDETAPGTLTHPVWGEISAYLTELTLAQEPRADYVAYTFTFREADSTNAIPK